MEKSITKSYLKELTYNVIGAAIEVHKEIGPGLLEKIYQKCLEEELKERKIEFKSEFIVPLKYKNVDITTELRCDLLIENVLVVELKSVEEIHPIFEAQILSYMKMLQVPQGILINFNVGNIFHEGQRTYVNELYRNLPE